LPRHSGPDDRGMYAAAIDPTNGYAYFVGEYLVKLDITGNLPAQVGPALDTGQSVEADIDSAAGYLYLPRGTIYRYALGAGSNAVSSAGSLTLAAGSAASIVIDDSDPNPTNHYAYVVCGSGSSTGKVAKVRLSNMTEYGSITLNAGESNFIFCTVADVPHGYAYFLARGAGIPQVVKIKFTPGTNAPVRVGAVSLDSTNVFIDGASIDTVHGYAYYGTYDSDTNVPGRVYKVLLGDGDVAPRVVGYVGLQSGEGRLAASIIDPQGGYVYFADDNSYPGSVYQLSLNGTNPPVEISRLMLQGGWSNPPPNGVTASNTTTNNDGLLPFGEVYFRSAVYDPLRGFAYFGQDSRPNQVVKVQIRSPFELWQSANFGDNATNSAIAGDLADPDGDGLPNLLEYALGTDPNVANVGGLPAADFETDANGDYLTLTVNKNPSATDVTYIVEVSGDLATWSSGPSFTTTLQNTPSLLKVRDNIPIAIAPQRFIRLRITHP